MTNTNRERLAESLRLGRVPASAIIPDAVLFGRVDFPAWVLEVLCLTEE